MQKKVSAYTFWHSIFEYRESSSQYRLSGFETWLTVVETTWMGASRLDHGSEVDVECRRPYWHDSSREWIDPPRPLGAGKAGQALQPNTSHLLLSVMFVLGCGTRWNARRSLNQMRRSLRVPQSIDCRGPSDLFLARSHRGQLKVKAQDHFLESAPKRSEGEWCASTHRSTIACACDVY